MVKAAETTSLSPAIPNSLCSFPCALAFTQQWTDYHNYVAAMVSWGDVSDSSEAFGGDSLGSDVSDLFSIYGVMVDLVFFSISSQFNLCFIYDVMC